jgi:hypothetical protein
MKRRTVAIFAGSLALFLHAVLSVQAQGTFQNLGFESATVTGVPGTFLSISQAFPSWTG